MATPSNGDPNNKTVTGYPVPGPATAQPASQSYVSSLNPNPNSDPPPIAAAYPYQYPPQNGAYYHQSYPPPQQPAYLYNNYRPNPRPTALRRLLIAAIGAVVIVGVIFFIFWLVLKPRVPIFRVDSATVSGLNATQSGLNGTWAFSLFIRNPNTKLTVAYGELEAAVTFDDRERYGLTRLAPFEQGKGQERTVNFQLGAWNEYADDKTVKKINEKRQLGSAYFGVRLMGWVRFRSGVWSMRQHLLSVYCDPIEFKFNSNNGTGVFQGPSKMCDVSM
jgi:hypothetical protein